MSAKAGFVFGCHACVWLMFTGRKSVCWKLVFPFCVSSTVFAPGTLLWTGAPLLFCYSIFLPLFAQRLRAIIGPNTLQCSYLRSVHTRLSTKDIQVCEEADTYVHSCMEARRLAIANTIASSLFGLTPSPVWFCQVPRGPSQLAASLKGLTLHAEPCKTNRWVSLSLLPLPSIRFPLKKKKKKRFALLWANTAASFLNRQWLQKLEHAGSVPHKDPLSQSWTGAYL